MKIFLRSLRPGDVLVTQDIKDGSVAKGLLVLSCSETYTTPAVGPNACGDNLMFDVTFLPMFGYDDRKLITYPYHFYATMFSYEEVWCGRGHSVL